MKIKITEAKSGGICLKVGEIVTVTDDNIYGEHYGDYRLYKFKSIKENLERISAKYSYEIVGSPSLIPVIAEHLGVEVGERFNIVTSFYNPHILTNDGLFDRNNVASINMFHTLLIGKAKIEKLNPRLKEIKNEIDKLQKEYDSIVADKK